MTSGPVRSSGLAFFCRTVPQGHLYVHLYHHHARHHHPPPLVGNPLKIMTTYCDSGHDSMPSQIPVLISVSYSGLLDPAYRQFRYERAVWLSPVFLCGGGYRLPPFRIWCATTSKTTMPTAPRKGRPPVALRPLTCPRFPHGSPFFCQQPQTERKEQ